MGSKEEGLFSVIRNFLPIDVSIILLWFQDDSTLHGVFRRNAAGLLVGRTRTFALDLQNLALCPCFERRYWQLLLLAGVARKVMVSGGKLMRPGCVGSPVSGGKSP